VTVADYKMKKNKSMCQDHGYVFLKKKKRKEKKKRSASHRGERSVPFLLINWLLVASKDQAAFFTRSLSILDSVYFDAFYFKKKY